MLPVTLPFGKHRGQTLQQVPTDYLCWLSRSAWVKTGLRQAVAVELVRRGHRPAHAPSAENPVCPRCGPYGLPVHSWQQDCTGANRIRVSCSVCAAFIRFAPRRHPYVDMADATRSQTPVLDALVQAEDLGVKLFSDGERVEFFSADDWRRATPALRRLVKQCSHSLAGMLGKDDGRPHSTPKQWR